MRLGRFLLWFFKPLFYLIFPYKAIGKENIPPFSPDDRLIICANHISDIDPVLSLIHICSGGIGKQPANGCGRSWRNI